MSRPRGLQLELSYSRLRGSTVISACDGLTLFGPTVQVAIGIHEQLAGALTKQGDPVPDPIIGNAMIDTGATVTTVNANLIGPLNLPKSGKVRSFGIGGESEGFTVPCSINIRGLNVNIARAHCHEIMLTQNPIIALIGRDVLRHMFVVYNGPEGKVTLVLPKPSEPRKRASVKRQSKKRCKR